MFREKVHRLTVYTLFEDTSYDPLCSEGEIYAKRLKESGVYTTYACYDTIHGFFGSPGIIDQGKVAMAQASAALRVAFGN